MTNLQKGILLDLNSVVGAVWWNRRSPLSQADQVRPRRMYYRMPSRMRASLHLLPWSMGVDEDVRGKKGIKVFV